MFNKKKLFILSVLLLSTMFFFNMQEKGKASVINTDNKDSIFIACDDYLNNVSEINVYSNISYANYSLLLNGTEINNSTNPVNYSHYTWYPVDIVKKTADSLDYDSIEDIFHDDNVTANATSRKRWGDEYLRLEFYFSIYTLPVVCSFINHSSTRIQFKINMTSEGDPEKLRFQGYNYTSDAWQTITTLSDDSITTYNNTLYMCDFKDNQTNKLLFRIEAREYTPNQEIYAHVDYVSIYYEVNYTLEDSNDYEIIDKYNLNTSTYADGVYNLTAKIQDANGTWHQDTKFVTIDNTPPNITNFNFSMAEPSNLQALIITADINDANLNCTNLEWENQFNKIVNYFPSNPTIINFTDVFANGTYVFIIFAMDHAGNLVHEEREINITYAGQIEILTIITTETLKITFDIWSNNTQYILLYLDGDLLKNISGNSSYYDTNKTTEGEHKIYLETYVDSILYNKTTIYVTVPGDSGSNGDDDSGTNGGLDFFAGLALSDWILYIIIAFLLVALVYFMYVNSKKKKRRR
ncbi:MAG: hypothetical protein ACTSYS_13845 [Promethearchaeota archaeon]